MKYFNKWTIKQYNEILPWWPNIQLCFTTLILKLLVLFNSEIAKMEFSIFWIWGDLRFSRKSKFLDEIRRDLRRNFKFEEIWGNLRRHGNPVLLRNFNIFLKSILHLFKMPYWIRIICFDTILRTLSLIFN